MLLLQLPEGSRTGRGLLVRNNYSMRFVFLLPCVNVLHVQIWDIIGNTYNAFAKFIDQYPTLESQRAARAK